MLESGALSAPAAAWPCGGAPASARCSDPERTNLPVTFSDLDTAKTTATNQTRLKRQLAEQAIAQASAALWADAADSNRKLLEMGPDAEAENRLAKALWELGELAEAREHYQTALALDPTNPI